MSGAGWGSFASGFGEGLTGQILNNRQREDRKTQEEAERRARLGIALLPHAMENAESEDDLRDIFGMIDPSYGSAAKKGKKGSPFDGIAGHLGQIIGMRPKPSVVMDGPDTGGITGMMRPDGSMPPRPGAPASPSGAPEAVGGIDARLSGEGAHLPPPRDPNVPDVGGTLLGVHYGTAEQRDNQKIERARQVFQKMRTIDPAFTMDDALAMTGVKMPRDYASTAAAQFIDGEIPDPDNPGKWISQPGIFDRHNSIVYPGGHELAGQPIPGWRKRVSAGSQPSAGVAFNQAAIDLGFPNAAEAVAAGKGAELRARATEIAGGITGARTAASAKAKFEAPIDVTTAKNTNTVVGSTSADYQGQQVPTEAEQGKAKSMQVMRESLTNIRDNLLGILPSGTELQGKAPNAVSIWNANSNAMSRIKDPDNPGAFLSNRAAIARLQSAVEGNINVIAGVLAGAKGTQSEKDAERAESQLLALNTSLKSMLTNPLGGDTRESAQARINETLRALDRVAGSITPTPVPRPKTGAAAAPPAQFGLEKRPDGYVRDGVYITGPKRGQRADAPGR